MLRCRPVLAAARLGRNRPGWSGSGRGGGRRTMLWIVRSSTTRRAERGARGRAAGVAGDESPCSVVVEVAPLVGELAITGRNRLPGVATVVGTSLLAGQDLLGGAQPSGSTPPPARVGHVLAVGGGGEAGDPDVDADRGPGGLQ